MSEHVLQIKPKSPSNFTCVYVELAIVLYIQLAWAHFYIIITRTPIVLTMIDLYRHLPVARVQCYGLGPTAEI